MPLLKRSYEKQTGNFFLCKNLFGDYLDKYPYKYGYDINKTIEGLSEKGKKMMTKFIEINKRREKLMLKNENKLFEDSRNHKLPKSKTPLWKSGLHIMEHFGDPLIDKCYKFRDSPIIKHKFNQPPFKRTKITGDYFDKTILKQI